MAAADNGRIIGVQLEAGKIFQLARTRLWETNGQLISQGPLPSEVGWSSYVAPLGMDLTADGVFAVYGYSGYTGIVGFDAIFRRGHYAILSDTKTNITLLSAQGQSGYEYPTTFGRRVVAAQGSTVVTTIPDGGNPFTQTWGGLVDTSGVAGSPSLRRTDVAATGTRAAVEFRFDPGDDRIGALALSSMNVPVNPGDPPVDVGGSVDCFLPTVGEASDASWSQDGTRIAWKDGQGVKVAGAPTGTAESCALSSPPVVISATGSYPSIGGSDLPLLAPPAPAPAPAPGRRARSGCRAFDRLHAAPAARGRHARQGRAAADPPGARRREGHGDRVRACARARAQRQADRRSARARPRRRPAAGSRCACA